MPAPTPPRLAENALHALVDDQLPPADATAAAAELALDAQAARQVADWRRQRAQLRALHTDVLDEPLPAALVAATVRPRQAPLAWTGAWRWGGVAASVLLAFGAGWTGHGLWRHAGAGATAAAAARAPQDFMRQAAVAHAIYAPEVRHPVEVTAAEQAHLVQWLSRRLARPLQVPDLSPEGWSLVGGRLLPGEAGARAQFMFQNAAGTRLTLYLGAVGAAAPPGVQPEETAFRFTQDGPVPGFYWVDQGFGYALAGPLERAELQRLAQAVFRQL